MERTSSVRFVVMLVALSVVMLGDVALLSLISASLRTVEGWATFVPDLVVGVITTGLLGLLLWLLTKRIESNLDRRTAQRAALNRWSVVQRRIANAVNTLDFADDVTDASSLGPVADKLIEILENEPLPEWLLLVDSDEMELADATLKQLERTVSRGTAVNSAIQFWYGTVSSPRKASLEQVRAIQIGSTLGFDREITARTMGVKPRHVEQLLKEIDAQVNSDLNEKLVSYEADRQVAEENVARLRVAVEMRAKSG